LWAKLQQIIEIQEENNKKLHFSNVILVFFLHFSNMFYFFFVHFSNAKRKKSFA